MLRVVKVFKEHQINQQLLAFQERHTKYTAIPNGIGKLYTSIFPIFKSLIWKYLTTQGIN